MGQFHVEKTNEGNAEVITIKGRIDEDANLDAAVFTGDRPVILDLEGITAINSCGIRDWIKWLQGQPKTPTILFRRCPRVIVDQMNMVAGFLPDNGEVESFYVPYFNEASGNEKMVLFKKGEEFSGGQVHLPAEVKDDATGEPMDLDVIEAKYFKFLKK